MATRDIWLFSASDNLEGELQLSFGNAAKQVQGIEKLANIFVHTFLTDLGSDLVYSDTGSTLAEVLGSNIYLNSELLRAIIRLSVREVENIMIEDQDETLPDDERLSSATLLDFSVISDTISIRVEITSEAGELRTIVVPNKFAL